MRLSESASAPSSSSPAVLGAGGEVGVGDAPGHPGHAVERAEHAASGWPTRRRRPAPGRRAPQDPEEQDPHRGRPGRPPRPAEWPTSSVPRSRLPAPESPRPAGARMGTAEAEEVAEPGHPLVGRLGVEVAQRLGGDRQAPGQAAGGHRVVAAQHHHVGLLGSAKAASSSAGEEVLAARRRGAGRPPRRAGGPRRVPLAPAAPSSTTAVMELAQEQRRHDAGQRPPPRRWRGRASASLRAWRSVPSCGARPYHAAQRRKRSWTSTAGGAASSVEAALAARCRP